MMMNTFKLIILVSFMTMTLYFVVDCNAHNRDSQQFLTNTNHAKQVHDKGPAKCAVGFGACGVYTNPVGVITDIPCTYDGPPQTIDPISNEELLDKFDKICPSLNVLENSTLCCDVKQIDTLLTSIKTVEQFLGGCPSCLINFSQFFCDLICNPRQADFVKVTKFGFHEGGYTKPAVDEITYTINENWVNEMYASCSSVVSTAAQSNALDIICGEGCNPKKLIQVLGLNKTSPYQINYEYTNSSESERPIVHCYESVGDTYKRLMPLYPGRCTRNDCPTVNPEPPKPNNNNDSPKILERIGLYILVTFLFIIFTALVSIIFDSCFDHRLIDMLLKEIFRKWALFCTHYATLIILLGLACVTLSCVGLTKLQILTDPVNLWSQRSSQAHQDKLYYEETFGPFYRAEQVIIYPKEVNLSWFTYINNVTNETTTFSNVFELNFLKSALKLQQEILNITAQYKNEYLTLKDICLQPVRKGFCAIQSPLDWFGGIEENFYKGNITEKDYLSHFLTCAKGNYQAIDSHYEDLSCLGPYGGPIRVYLALAGYPEKNYNLAKALVFSIPVLNTPKDDDNKKAKAWENEFIKLLTNYNDINLKVTFYSERSIEDEIERQSHSDVITIAISYLVMFAYVAISLGRTTSLRSFLLESRIVLGLGGVLIVLASVLTSLGILSFFGVKATLIIIEVIPFLVLAVGVDNIFIIVQAVQRSSNSRNLIDSTIEERISYVIGEVGPSLLLASLSESACFLIGTLTPMPAIKVFAMTASLALLVDFILQMTVFIGLLTLDTKRQSSGRYDLLCCITASKASQTSLIATSESETPPQNHQGLSSVTDSVSPISSPDMNTARRQDNNDLNDSKFIYPIRSRDPLLYRFFEQYFAPFLMIDWVRAICMVVFLSWLIISAYVIPKIDVGLDQTMSVPDDSYIQDYFTSQKNDLRVGPPVIFVLKRGLDFSNSEERKTICSSSTCNSDSMVNKILDAPGHKSESYIETITNSWIDGYQSWASDTDNCCRMFTKSPPTHKRKFCPPDTVNITTECGPCDLWNNNSFNVSTFYDYIEDYVNDRITPQCGTGGAGRYDDLVKIADNNLLKQITSDPTKSTQILRSYSPEDNRNLIDSAFLTYHVPLKDSKDFIEAMKSSRALAQDIQKMLNDKLGSMRNLEVFAYCFIYAFYEQYLTIWQQVIRNLAISMMTIFVVSYLLLGCDLYISLVILGTIGCIVIDLMGLMYFWNIQLNAISMVNLVMAVGISVEFCSHIARSYACSTKDNHIERSKDALIKMGSSVLSGITITKVAGIIILAFAKSKIFKVYYFRMYMGIVMVGATHGIIFMPIILSLSSNDMHRISNLVLRSNEP